MTNIREKRKEQKKGEIMKKSAENTMRSADVECPQQGTEDVEEPYMGSIDLVPMSIHDQISIRDKRREERLKRMKERQFDQPTLHQLFRVFDSTNSHVLSLTDFQTGLIAMGFKEAEGKCCQYYVLLLFFIVH